jgi:hypothetical protein
MAEVMVFARHTRKWEIAKKAGEWWERRDGSTICRIGQEVATHALPPAPQLEVELRQVLARFHVGTRVRLAEDVDRFPDFVATAGLTGTVVATGDAGIVLAVRLDEPLLGAEEENNEIWWTADDVGERGFAPPLMVLAEQER